MHQTHLQDSTTSLHSKIDTSQAEKVHAEKRICNAEALRITLFVVGVLAIATGFVTEFVLSQPDIVNIPLYVAGSTLVALALISWAIKSCKDHSTVQDRDALQSRVSIVTDEDGDVSLLHTEPEKENASSSKATHSDEITAQPQTAPVETPQVSDSEIRGGSKSEVEHVEIELQDMSTITQKLQERRALGSNLGALDDDPSTPSRHLEHMGNDSVLRHNLALLDHTHRAYTPLPPISPTPPRSPRQSIVFDSGSSFASLHTPEESISKRQKIDVDESVATSSEHNPSMKLDFQSQRILHSSKSVSSHLVTPKHESQSKQLGSYSAPIRLFPGQVDLERTILLTSLSQTPSRSQRKSTPQSSRSIASHHSHSSHLVQDDVDSDFVSEGLQELALNALDKTASSVSASEVDGSLASHLLFSSTPNALDKTASPSSQTPTIAKRFSSHWRTSFSPTYSQHSQSGREHGDSSAFRSPDSLRLSTPRSSRSALSHQSASKTPERDTVLIDDAQAISGKLEQTDSPKQTDSPASLAQLRSLSEQTSQSRVSLDGAAQVQTPVQTPHSAFQQIFGSGSSMSISPAPRDSSKPTTPRSSSSMDTTSSPSDFNTPRVYLDKTHQVFIYDSSTKPTWKATPVKHQASASSSDQTQTLISPVSKISPVRTHDLTPVNMGPGRLSSSVYQMRPSPQQMLRASVSKSQTSPQGEGDRTTQHLSPSPKGFSKPETSQYATVIYTSPAREGDKLLKSDGEALDSSKHASGAAKETAAQLRGTPRETLSESASDTVSPPSKHVTPRLSSGTTARSSEAFHSHHQSARVSLTPSKQSKENVVQTPTASLVQSPAHTPQGVLRPSALMNVASLNIDSLLASPPQSEQGRTSFVGQGDGAVTQRRKPRQSMYFGQASGSSPEKMSPMKKHALGEASLRKQRQSMYFGQPHAPSPVKASPTKKRMLGEAFASAKSPTRLVTLGSQIAPTERITFRATRTAPRLSLLETYEKKANSPSKVKVVSEATKRAIERREAAKRKSPEDATPKERFMRYVNTQIKRDRVSELFTSMFSKIITLIKRDKSLATSPINQDGDNILHLAVMCFDVAAVNRINNLVPEARDTPSKRVTRFSQPDKGETPCETSERLLADNINHREKHDLMQLIHDDLYKLKTKVTTPEKV